MTSLADILLKINDDLEVESELREVSRPIESRRDLYSHELRGGRRASG
jgi:hypothetical protein